MRWGDPENLSFLWLVPVLLAAVWFAERQIGRAHV